MERIKSFKLFESSTGDAFNIRGVYSPSEYINAYAFSKSGMCRANFTKNFKNWLIYKSYENILIYKEEKTDSVTTSNIMNSFKKDIESLTKCPDGYNENDFDYAKVIKDPAISISVNSLIKQISSGLSACPPVNTANDLPIMRIFQDAVRKNITDILDNIFWPGNMPTIKELKYIDIFDTKQMESLGITKILKESLEKTCDKYSTMEKDIVSLGKKFMDLLKEIGDNKIEALREMELSDVVTNTIVEYFSKSEDSFKVADEIRRGNENIYNKIKALLPNIDTSADLGDLGF